MYCTGIWCMFKCVFSSMCVVDVRVYVQPFLDFDQSSPHSLNLWHHHHLLHDTHPLMSTLCHIVLDFSTDDFHLVTLQPMTSLPHDVLYAQLFRGTALQNAMTRCMARPDVLSLCLRLDQVTLMEVVVGHTMSLYQSDMWSVLHLLITLKVTLCMWRHFVCLCCCMLKYIDKQALHSCRKSMLYSIPSFFSST